MRAHANGRRPLYCIVPPYIFEKMLESPDKSIRDAAVESLTQSAQLRGQREAMAELGAAAVAVPRTVGARCSIAATASC
jgi:hypothetical protein